MKLLVKNCGNQERTGHRQFSPTNRNTLVALKKKHNDFAGAVAQVLT